jgi:hypothetical protein
VDVAGSPVGSDVPGTVSTGVVVVGTDVATDGALLVRTEGRVPLGTVTVGASGSRRRSTTRSQT